MGRLYEPHGALQYGNAPGLLRMMERRVDYRTAPCLAAARAAATALLDTLAARCATLELEALETVAAAGSLGRLEIATRSDFDAVFVARAGAAPARVEREIAAVLDAAAACGLVPPKPDGIFRDAVSRAALLEPGARGRLDEPPALFGKRMQCLLDARPLYGAAAFRELRGAVLQWYADGRPGLADLQNDLKRYLHSYAAWQQHKRSRSDDDSWALRQAKLGTVRLLTFAGLLVLLGAASCQADAERTRWLASRLDATPLERLALVMGGRDPHAFQRVLADYEFCFARLSDAAFRQRLIDHDDDMSQAGAATAALGEIAPAAERLLHELTAFVLAQRERWDAGFFSGLVFWGRPYS